MSLKIQIARGLKWQAIYIVGRQVLSLAVVTTLARLLAPSDFGLVALVGVYLGIVMMFVDQGLTQAVIQKQNLADAHKDAAFWFNMGCATVLCLGTVVLAGPVAELFKEPRLVPLLRWSSLGLIIGAASAIHASLFTKAMDFRRPVLRALIASAVGGAVGIGMALAGCGVWSLVAQQLVGEAAGTVFLWSMSSYRPSLRFSWRHFRELFGFSSSVFATSVLWFFSSRLDQMVIGRFAGMSALGLYTVAGKLPNLATTMTKQPLAIVSLPSLSTLQGDHEKMRRTVCQGMELNALVSFAVFVGLAAIAPELVPLLFGAKWADAAVLCSWLSLFGLVDGLLVFCYPVLLASGGIGKYVWLNVWHTVGVLTACLVGIQFGVAPLIMGLILNNLVIAIPALLFVRHRIGLSPLSYLKPCLVPVIASLFMVCMIWFMTFLMPAGAHPVVMLAGKILVGSITYIGGVLVLAPSILKKFADVLGHAFRQSNAFGNVPVKT